MDDLVSREAVKKWLERWDGYVDMDIIRRMQYRVIDIPPTQPERMRGRWVPVTNGRGGYECDQCHNYAPSYQDGVEWLSDFCPNCGADMRGEQDEY